MSNFIMVFDTETTGLDKCFCYDIGYQIMDTESAEIIISKHMIIEQVWHNLPLFESAYYKDKRPLYIKLMRQHKAIMTKWGYAMQEMIRDIKKYEITDAYAYNSDFDDKIFNFNCDWFKTINPFDNVAIHDIWGYASEWITWTDDYKTFCEQNQYFTDTGNYKASAEIVYRYLRQDTKFNEAHMGLYDVEIESIILFSCVNRGAQWHYDYPVNKILKREQEKPFTIKINGKEMVKGVYLKKYIRNDIYNFTCRE